MLKYFTFCSLLMIALLSSLSSPLYFKNTVIYHGHEGTLVNQFRNLISSEEIENKFNDLLNTRPIGFYYDTLKREVYLNNYEIEKKHINPIDSSDLSRFCSLSRIDITSADYRLVKQDPDKINTDKLFIHKIPMDFAKKRILWQISSDFVDRLIKKKKNEHTVKLERLVDLNNDGVKEKLSFYLSYQEGLDARQPLLVKLRINCAEIRNNVWKIYDQVTFTQQQQQIEGVIESISVFKLVDGQPPLIYIDTSYETLTGFIQRSQLLLTASNNQGIHQIITVN